MVPKETFRVPIVSIGFVFCGWQTNREITTLPVCASDCRSSSLTCWNSLQEGQTWRGACGPPGWDLGRWTCCTLRLARAAPIGLMLWTSIRPPGSGSPVELNRENLGKASWTKPTVCKLIQIFKPNDLAYTNRWSNRQFENRFISENHRVATEIGNRSDSLKPDSHLKITLVAEIGNQSDSLKPDSHLIITSIHIW